MPKPAGQPFPSGPFPKARRVLPPASRRAFSMRFIGDDVKYIERGGITSPPFDGINLKTGDLMRDDWFPIVFSS